MQAARVRNGEPHRTWDEIAEIVHEMKVLQFKLSIRNCHDFSVRTNPDVADSKRVYFLGVPEPALSGKSTILYYDFEESLGESNIRKSDCKQLIGELALSDQYSKDEALLRERKRMGTIGITNYELHADSGRIVFPANGGLYTIVDDFSASAYQPSEIVTPVTLAKRGQQQQAPADGSQKAVADASHGKDEEGEESPALCGACLDAKLCPSDPNLIAYVYANDLWVTDIQAGVAQRLTFTQKLVSPTDSAASSNRKRMVSAGVPSFVMQEEFDRFSGFWWQPSADSSKGTHYLLYEELDESDVPIVKLMNISGVVEKYRYPRAGRQNSRSKLKVLRLSKLSAAESGSSGKSAVFNAEDLALPPAVENQLFTGANNEYLVRAGWFPRGDAIWMRILDRGQHELRLIGVPLASFSKDSSATAVYYNLLSIHDSAWVNVDDCFYMFSGSSLAAIELLVGHEQSGFRHLSLYRGAVTAGGQVNINESVLTNGEWEVQKKALWIDERTRTIYFLADRDSPLTRQLFRVRIDAALSAAPGDAVERISDVNFFLHEAAFASDFHAYCASVSNPQTMQHVRVYSLRESTETRASLPPASASASAAIKVRPPSAISRNRMDVDESARCASESRNSLDSLAVNASTSVASSLTDDFAETMRREADADIELSGDGDTDTLPVPETTSLACSFGMYQSDADILRCMRGESFEFVRSPGEPVLHGLIFKPLELLNDSENGSKRYPTVIYAYGGPQIQLVTRSYLPPNLIRLCGLVRLGYIVVVVDNRGSAGRGHRFETELRYMLGHKEAADQVGCVRWLATRYPIDLDRVGIYGWSYGGYLSLMTLAQYPTAIRCAAACAPVTDWTLYDSGYTERYLDLPDANADGYVESSVLPRARALPNEPGRLLLVHGYADENVHFSHTAELLRLLVAYGKPYQLLIYPDERHGFRTLEASEHFETNLLHFFETNLRHAPVALTADAAGSSSQQTAAFDV